MEFSKRGDTPFKRGDMLKLVADMHCMEVVGHRHAHIEE
jgi:hypothetical protein